MKCYHWTLQQVFNRLYLKTLLCEVHFMLETAPPKIQQLKKKSSHKSSISLVKSYLRFMQIQWVGSVKRNWRALI